MPEIRFGGMDTANDIREKYAEHLCTDDNRSMKTVTFTSDTPEGVLDRAQLRAEESTAEDEQRKVMAGPLSEGTRDKIKENDGFSTDNTVFSWRRAKGVFEREGHGDRFHEAISLLADYDDPTEGAEQHIRNARQADATKGTSSISGAMDMGEEDIQKDRARADAARSALSSGCNHAEDHCEHGDVEACEYLRDACGFDESEVEQLLSGSGIKAETDEGDEDEPAKQTELVTVGGGDGEFSEMEVTPAEAGALRKSWQGYKAAVSTLPEMIDSLREEVINARQAGRAINAIREANGQDPVHWNELHDRLDALERLPASIPETRTLSHFGDGETAEPDESHEMPALEEGSGWEPTAFGYREKGLGGTRIEDEEVDPGEYVLALVNENGHETYIGDGTMGAEQSQKVVRKVAERVAPVDIKRADNALSEKIALELREIDGLPYDYQTDEEKQAAKMMKAADEYPDEIGPAELVRAQTGVAEWEGPDGRTFIATSAGRKGWSIKEKESEKRGGGYYDSSPTGKQEAIEAVRGLIETAYDEDEPEELPADAETDLPAVHSDIAGTLGEALADGNQSRVGFAVDTAATQVENGRMDREDLKATARAANYIAGIPNRIDPDEFADRVENTADQESSPDVDEDLLSGEETARVRTHAREGRFRTAIRSGGISGPSIMREIEETVGGDTIEDLLAYSGEWTDVKGIGPKKAERFDAMIPHIRQGYDARQAGELEAERKRPIPDEERANERTGVDQRRAAGTGYSESDEDLLLGTDYRPADRADPDADEPAIEKAERQRLTGPDDRGVPNEPDRPDEEAVKQRGLTGPDDETDEPATWKGHELPERAAGFGLEETDLPKYGRGSDTYMRIGKAGGRGDGDVGYYVIDQRRTSRNTYGLDTSGRTESGVSPSEAYDLLRDNMEERTGLPFAPDERSRPIDKAAERYSDELDAAPNVSKWYVQPTTPHLQISLENGDSVSVTLDSVSSKYTVTHSHPHDHQRRRASADDAVSLAVQALHRLDDGKPAFGPKNDEDEGEDSAEQTDPADVIETSDQQTITGDPVDPQSTLVGAESGDVQSETIDTEPENPGGLLADEREETTDSTDTKQSIPDEFAVAEGGQNTLGSGDGSTPDLDAARAERATDGGGPPKESPGLRLGWAADVLSAATNGYGDRVSVDAEMARELHERDADASLWTEQASQDVVRYGIDGRDALGRLVETAESQHKTDPQSAVIPVVDAAVAVAEDYRE